MHWHLTVHGTIDLLVSYAFWQISKLFWRGWPEKFSIDPAICVFMLVHFKGYLVQWENLARDSVDMDSRPLGKGHVCIHVKLTSYSWASSQRPELSILESTACWCLSTCLRSFVFYVTTAPRVWGRTPLHIPISATRYYLELTIHRPNVVCTKSVLYLYCLGVQWMANHLRG